MQATTRALTTPLRRRGPLAAVMLLAATMMATAAWAQPAPDKTEPAKPAPGKSAPDKAEPDGAAPDKPAPDAAPDKTTPSPDAAKPDKPAPKSTEGRDLLAEAIEPVPGGLRPEQVAKRGAETSPDAAAKRAELRAASTRVDQAVAAYFPRLTVGFSYTRQSPVVNAIDFDLSPLVSPIVNKIYEEHPNTSPIVFPAPADNSFPVIENIYQFNASLLVPVSDYLLRLTQAYAGVSAEQDAKRHEMRAAELQAALNAQVAYYNWIRTYGQARVAELAVKQADRHVRDVQLTERAGLASRADVLRLQSQRAQAQHLTRAAKGLNMVTEQQLRLNMHTKPDEKLSIGVDVMDLPPKVGSLSALQDRALANRLEIKALQETKKSLEEVESLQRAGMYPRVDAFANLLVANPNPRIFPQTQQWDATWDAGVRLSWTINDTFTQLGATAEANAQVQNIKARLAALKDGIKLSVVAAYNELQTAYSAVQAAEESEKAAELALSLRRRLLRGGKATATEIVDADAALTQARLQRINAHVDAHVAYAKLRHAVGGPLSGPIGTVQRRRAVARKPGPSRSTGVRKPARNIAAGQRR